MWENEICVLSYQLCTSISCYYLCRFKHTLMSFSLQGVDSKHHEFRKLINFVKVHDDNLSVIAASCKHNITFVCVLSNL